MGKKSDFVVLANGELFNVGKVKRILDSMNSLDEMEREVFVRMLSKRIIGVSKILKIINKIELTGDCK